MRHLRELYGNQTFNRVICGEPISIFTNTMTRFGKNQRAMMMPVLSVEFYLPTLADEQNQIRQIVWYHYRFYLPARDESPIMLDLPSKANRTISESELIIFEEINGELKPLEPLPQPANPRLCP